MPTEKNGSCYVIRTIGQLQAVQEDLKGCYELGNDIDASATVSWNGGEGFMPIGYYTSERGWIPFEGSFDGKNYTIFNLTVNLPNHESVGLFGGNEGVIKNVKMTNANITGLYYTAILLEENYGTIDNVEVAGDVTSYSITGGIIGYNSGVLKNSKVNGGGFVGTNEGTIEYSYALGTVTNSSTSRSTGGFVGDNNVKTSTIIRDSYSFVDVIGGNRVGSFAGEHVNNSGLIERSYAIGNVQASGSYLGGFVGYVAGGATAPNSFYNSETTGYPTSASGTAKLTTEMKQQSTFAGWDFTNVWGIDSSINNGYPYLKNNPPY